MTNEIILSDDEMFSYDIENDVNIINNNKQKNEAHESLIQPKSILYKNTDSDDITIVIIRTIFMFFIICFILPFIIIDLYIAYTDKTCVNEYPSKLKISISIYLQVNSYLLLLVLLFYIPIIYKKIEIHTCNKIIKTLIYLTMYVFRIIIFGWNILGGIIFWGYVVENCNCSIIIFNYLYITFVARLLIIILLILNSNNSIKNK